MTWTEILVGGGLIVGLLVLRQWVLPRFGVPT